MRRQKHKRQKHNRTAGEYFCSWNAQNASLAQRCLEFSAVQSQTQPKLPLVHFGPKHRKGCTADLKLGPFNELVSMPVQDGFTSFSGPSRSTLKWSWTTVEKASSDSASITWATITLASLLSLCITACYSGVLPCSVSISRTIPVRATRFNLTMSYSVSMQCSFKYVVSHEPQNSSFQ